MEAEDAQNIQRILIMEMRFYYKATVIKHDTGTKKDMRVNGTKGYRNNTKSI